MRHGFAPRIGIATAALLSFALPSLAQPYPERQIGGIGVTVFRDENFRGRNATFRQDIPDLKAYGFNDRITSLRVAPGQYWEACERPDYQGRCQVFSGEESDLRRIGWTDRISSLRRVRGGGRPPSLGKFGIVLYDDPLFTGRSVTVKDAVDNLRSMNFHDRTESVRVVAGTWELCAEPGYRRCQTVDGDVAHLSTLGLNKKLSSVRPVGRDEGGGGDYPPTYPSEARLVLFEDEGYRGPSLAIDTATTNLGRFGRARSLQVISGTWLVCDGPRFTGRCEQVSSSVPDLDRWGRTGTIRSARPVDRY
jgi:hypothetical protein